MKMENTKYVLFFRDTHEESGDPRPQWALSYAQDMPLGWIYHVLSPRIGMDLGAVVNAVNRYVKDYESVVPFDGPKIYREGEVLVALHRLTEKGYVHSEERYLAYVVEGEFLSLRREDWSV